MKKKFQGNTEEILKLHKQQKTEKMILREQAGDLKSELQAMVDDGRVTDAISIVGLQTTNPERRYAIKKESKKNPGTFVYLFRDGKYGTFGADGKFTYGSGVWVPSTPKAKVIDTKFKDKEVESYKTKFGAKTKEEAIDAGWDMTNLKKITVNGVDLYMPSSRESVVVGVSDEQKGALTAYKDRYDAKEWDELTPAEKALDWKELDVPDSKRLFGRDVKLYVKSSSRMKVDDKTYKDMRTEYDLTEKECVEKILAYFDDYRTGRPFGKDYFINEKPKVQFCKNKYHNKWGIRLNANKLNNILDLMSGNLNDYQGVRLPNRRGTGSEWFLTTI